MGQWNRQQLLAGAGATEPFVRYVAKPTDQPTDPAATPLPDVCSDACCAAGQPLVSGAAIGTDGQLTVYCHGEDGASVAAPFCWVVPTEAGQWDPQCSKACSLHAPRHPHPSPPTPSPSLQAPATAASSPRRLLLATAHAAWMQACWGWCLA